MNKTQTQDTRSGSFAGHTPGPWRLLGCQVAGPDETASFGGPIRRYYRPVADCSASVYTYAALNDDPVYLEQRSSHPDDNVRVPSWQEAEANARLIAAAPSLLAVNAQLIAALGRIADIEAGPLDPREDSLWRSDIARAALSAARALEGHGNAGTLKGGAK